MVAVRSILLIRGTNSGPYEAAASTTADAVMFDLAAPETHHERSAVRSLVARHAPLIAKRGREVQVRVSDARSGELDADIEAITNPSIRAVVLSGAEEPQDVRDADIAIRKREMRRKMEPGHVRLIPEVDSAAGLRALTHVLSAVDRHGAVALNIEMIAHDLGMAPPASSLAATMPLIDHAMASVAFDTAAVGLPWVLLAPRADHGTRSALATRAHAIGASGVYVASESEAAGFRQLFTLPRERVTHARTVLDEWERVRSAGKWVGVTAGELVDRRSVRRARRIVAQDAEHQSEDRTRRG